jgi:hypothetical protein
MGEANLQNQSGNAWHIHLERLLLQLIVLLLDVPYLKVKDSDRHRQ